MGLDMSLTGKYWIGNSDKELAQAVNKELNLSEEFQPEEVSISLMYWRKANAIHNWFVANCGEGVDECNPYFVDDSQLSDLLKLCEKVLINPETAEHLLPTAAGFFFGGTEYDEYYFQTLEDTVEMLKKIIRFQDSSSLTVYYQASW